VYTYGCNDVCQRYHIATKPDEVVLIHNNTKIGTVNELLEEAELCGERCRFSKNNFNSLVMQIMTKE
jgi:hypothetical protein